MADLFNMNEDDNWKLSLINCIAKSFDDNADKNDIYEKAGQFYLCYAPNYLYKYYSDADRNIDAVKSNKMWYAAPIGFNDVFDCDIAIDEKGLFNSSLKQVPKGTTIRKGSHMWLQLKKTLQTELKPLGQTIEELKRTTGISCLSESCDSLLMWAHYANNHCGICAEYELLEISKQLNFTPVPIIYDKDRAVYGSIDDNAVEVFIKSLTSKSPEWSYEKEWRIIQEDKACGNSWDYQKNGALLDMITPHSIILGCMVNPEFEKDMKEYCEENGINLYKMEKDPHFYKLIKTPVLKFDE